MNKASVEEAKKYMSDMLLGVRMQLSNPNSPYFGLEGHKRLARECGYALNDFDKKGQDVILKTSYSTIYVRGCNLKPLLDAKEWIGIMRKQIKTERR